MYAEQQLRIYIDTIGVFTLPDTESDKKWLVWNCVEVFILHRDKLQYRFTLDSIRISWISRLVSVSGRVKCTISEIMFLINGKYINIQCRLGLERGDTAEEALNVICTLLEKYGQGGPCCENKSDTCYYNSFIIADGKEAWVLETSGKHWAAEKVTGNMKSCFFL